MKKTIAVILLITAVCTASVFADGNWDLSLTAGYDHQSCNDNSCNAVGMTFAAKTKFHKDIDLYADLSVHAWGDYKFVTSSETVESLSDNNMGFKTHLGFLFDFPTKNEDFEFGLGPGAAFARSIASKGKGNAQEKYGFTNLGFSIIGIGKYSLNDTIAIVGELIPDIYIFHWDTLNINNETRTTDQTKLGFGLSAKIGISYSL